MKKILFVGAGPVGLLSAIQAKLYCPDLPITMIECYPEYQRNHPVHINKRSFKGSHPNKDFQKFVHDLPDSIRTSELESGLLNYAKKLGIEIEYARLINPNQMEEMLKKYPNTRLIPGIEALIKEYDPQIVIGADGSHSVVHDEVFKDYQFKKTMKYVAEIKYEVEGKTRALSKGTETIPVMSYAKHYISEFVGKEKNGKTPVSVRFFVSKQTYESMQTATFKNPYNLSMKEQIDADLLKSIKTWLEARHELAHENRIEGSERISVTNLPIYASQHFTKELNGIIFFLVGDAAFGVPYFKSLNNGILCSSSLAKAIRSLVNEKPVKTNKQIFSFAKMKHQMAIQLYEWYVQSLVNQETLFAELKTLGVTSLETSSGLSQVVPVAVSATLLKTNEGLNFKQLMNESSQAVGSFMNSLFKVPSVGNELEEENLQHNKSSCRVM